MTKLKELLSLNELTYNDGPSEKHQRKMNRVVTLFESQINLPNKPFPENTSKQTLEELKYLEGLESDSDFVKEHDDVDKVFRILHKELELEYNREEVKGLLKQSVKYIFELKYKYQRPRPYQIAEFYGISLNSVDLNSMKTPSYPSGHATQGYLLGSFYSKRYPEHREEFMQTAEDIAYSRIVGKAHYPSDKQFGKELAEKLFSNLV
tara:strand:- start:506 stop:1126 length:621 start_codon:yes stop_codon:yes gene_type:complete